jgi:hypothetical protein
MDVFDDDFDEEMIRAVEDVHGPILDDLYITEQYDNFPEENVKHVLESVYTAGVTEFQKTINKKVQELTNELNTVAGFCGYIYSILSKIFSVTININ